jgi:ubiquitin-conjugating enzyme E2 M
MKTTFPDPSDALNFTLTITPDEGMLSSRSPKPSRVKTPSRPSRLTWDLGIYKNGQFDFTFAINLNYPHEPPKVRCTKKIYHPNLDLDGNVCL